MHTCVCVGVIAVLLTVFVRPVIAEGLILAPLGRWTLGKHYRTLVTAKGLAKHAEKDGARKGPAEQESVATRRLPDSSWRSCSRSSRAYAEFEKSEDAHTSRLQKEKKAREKAFAALQKQGQQGQAATTTVASRREFEKAEKKLAAEERRLKKARKEKALKDLDDALAAARGATGAAEEALTTADGSYVIGSARWHFAVRKAYDKRESVVKRFSEAAWRACLYTLVFLYGATALLMEGDGRVDAKILQDPLIVGPEAAAAAKAEAEAAAAAGAESAAASGGRSWMVRWDLDAAVDPEDMTPMGVIRGMYKFGFDTDSFWLGYPFHGLSVALRGQYLLASASYLHQLLAQLVDNMSATRSDWLEMCIHHVATLALLIFSFVTGWHRFGVIILILHDFSDIFLEVAKCVHYHASVSNFAAKTCDALFAVFAVVFFVTRLVVYPRYVVMTVFGDASAYLGRDFLAFFVFSILLLVLQALHVFWFYLIARMAFMLFTEGGIKGDIRSEDDADNYNASSTQDDDADNHNSGEQQMELPAETEPGPAAPAAAASAAAATPQRHEHSASSPAKGDNSARRRRK